MESIRIKQITEGDIDGVIRSAGGNRIEDEGSADYQLNEALIELKLVQEEGLKKETRQAKLAKLFRLAQPTRPVIVVKPSTLDEEDQRDYYNMLAGPIKTHVKKAAQQLDKTASVLNPMATRVLLLINIGYTALLPDEFKAVCIKCVRNDSSKIDWIICGGVYYHSDGFDNYILTRFEEVQINADRPFPSRDRLLQEWSRFLDEAMAVHIRRGPLDVGRLPTVDLVFELDGVRFIKPSPRMPPSSFWPGGRRPRSNSREHEPPEPLASTFPFLSFEDWKQFRAALLRVDVLRESYSDWLKLQNREDARLHNPKHPFVLIPVQFDEFARAMGKPASEWLFVDVCRFANDRCNARTKSVLESAKDEEASFILPIEYIHVTIEEIGSDKANDVCTIRHVCSVPGFERSEVIVGDVQAFLEEAVCIGACYAVKRNVEALRYCRING